MDRPSWKTYFMEIAELAASRATCVRRQVGAVIVLDNNIVSTGYNGVPCGIQHCDMATCLRHMMNIPSGERHELCRGLHAEQNAIIQAAKHGKAIDGATVYCTLVPCIICAKMIINSGIKCVVFKAGYNDSLSHDMLQEAGIVVEKYQGDDNVKS